MHAKQNLGTKGWGKVGSSYTCLATARLDGERHGINDVCKGRVRLQLGHVILELLQQSCIGCRDRVRWHDRGRLRLVAPRRCRTCLPTSLRRWGFGTGIAAPFFWCHGSSHSEKTCVRCKHTLIARKSARAYAASLAMCHVYSHPVTQRSRMLAC